MSYQLVCGKCGDIREGLIPLVSKDTEIGLYCQRCDNLLINIFGSEHAFTKYIQEMNKINPPSKINTT